MNIISNVSIRLVCTLEVTFHLFILIRIDLFVFCKMLFKSEIWKFFWYWHWWIKSKLLEVISSSLFDRHRFDDIDQKFLFIFYSVYIWSHLLLKKTHFCHLFLFSALFGFQIWIIRVAYLNPQKWIWLKKKNLFSYWYYCQFIFDLWTHVIIQAFFINL